MEHMIKTKALCLGGGGLPHGFDSRVRAMPTFLTMFLFAIERSNTNTDFDRPKIIFLHKYYIKLASRPLSKPCIKLNGWDGERKKS